MDKSVPGSESEPTVMKRHMKRLTLNRETLRHLNAAEASAARGGASGRACPVTQNTLCTNTCLLNCMTNDSCPTQCPDTYCCASG